MKSLAGFPIAFPYRNCRLAYLTSTAIVDPWYGSLSNPSFNRSLRCDDRAQSRLHFTSHFVCKGSTDGLPSRNALLIPTPCNVLAAVLRPYVEPANGLTVAKFRPRQSKTGSRASSVLNHKLVYTVDSILTNKVSRRKPNYLLRRSHQ